jgi:hypothetical protein
MTKEAAMIMVTGKGTQKKDPTKAKATWKIIGKTMIYAAVDLPFMLDPEHIDSQNVQ